MILSPVIFIFLAASFGSVVVSFQNGDAASNGVHQVRALAEKEFYQLDCNSKFSTCLTWTSQYGTRKTYSKRVLVKCGECIQMDHPGPELILSDGIDIRGKLVFPDGYKLTVNSTMIVVQGELVMEASKPVDGDPSIKFVMTGEVDQTFTPIGQNSQACGGNVCNVGKKSITVAGGKIRSKDLHFDEKRFCHVLSLTRSLPYVYLQFMDYPETHQRGQDCTMSRMIPAQLWLILQFGTSGVQVRRSC